MTSLPANLPLFPLGEVVHFPDTVLPLHIFEPRYRELLADALASHNHIGMVLLRGGEEEGIPSIYDVGCAGLIREHKTLDDGRSLVVLDGRVRYRIREELEPRKSYREASVQALHEAPAAPEKVRVWAAELRAVLDKLVHLFGGDADSVDTLFSSVGEAHLVNALSAALPLSMVEKQSLLECATLESRYARLMEFLAFKEAEARLGMGTPNQRRDN